MYISGHTLTSRDFVTSQNLENVEKIDNLDDRSMVRAIRDAIIAEETAINQYEVIVDSTDNKKVKEVLQSIANEEKVHVGELQSVLNMLLGDEKDFLEEGEQEVKSDVGEIDEITIEIQD